MPRRGADREPYAELARSGADGKRQDACDTHDSDRQRDDRKSSEDERVEPIRRQHFGADIIKRRRALYRLVSRQLADQASDRRDERVRVRTSVNEQSPSSRFLAEWVVHVHRRAGHDVLIVEVRDDPDDPPRLPG